MTDQLTPENATVEEEPMAAEAAAEAPVAAERRARPPWPPNPSSPPRRPPWPPRPRSTRPRRMPLPHPSRSLPPSQEPATAPRRGEKAAKSAPATPRPAGPRGLQLKYRTDVIPALVKQFEYANPNQVPRLDKIVVNVGLGEALSNAKAIDAASGDLTTITGQKPIVMKARRSIAQFKIRTGNPIGLKVTLRGERMWDFLERLTILTLPRIRDFRGIPSKSFDGRGNYTLGLREQIAFPEIDYDKVDRLRGLEISIVTTAKSDEESKRMLELLGMPFAS